VTDQPQLTPREMDVLRLLCSGVHSDADLAAALSISEHTVHFHIGQLAAKLSVNSRVQLVAYALIHGLVPDVEWQGGGDKVA
jgi:DNA-binding CsgD family transcriptional regulator